MKEAIHHKVWVFNDLVSVPLPAFEGWFFFFFYLLLHSIFSFWQTLYLEPWEWVMDLPGKSPGLLAIHIAMVRMCPEHQLATQSGKYLITVGWLSYIWGSFLLPLTFCWILKNQSWGAEVKLAQQLRVPVVLAEGPSCIPSTYMVAHNRL